MNMMTEISIMLIYALMILLLCFMGKVLLLPAKLLGKLLLNSIVGGILLILINMVGMPFAVHIPLNPLSAVLAGLLGFPGLLLLFLLNCSGMQWF